MKQTLYTAGYQGHTPETLLQLAERLNAGIVDVRFKPASINPHWRYNSLTQSLGLRYVHMAPWGNVRYKAGPPVQLADFEGGLRCLSEWLSSRPAYSSAILLCQCKEAECCHRTTLAQKLRPLGYTVQELDWRQATEVQS